MNNLVLFNKDAYNKLLNEVPKYKMITTSVLADRLNVNGSLARAAIRELAKKGLIKPVSTTHRCARAILAGRPSPLTHPSRFLPPGCDPQQPADLHSGHCCLNPVVVLV